MPPRGYGRASHSDEIASTKFQLFFIKTRRLFVSSEGLNSFLALLIGELWLNVSEPQLRLVQALGLKQMCDEH